MHEFVKDLIRKIDNREFVVGVLGLGYVGQPLAETFLHAGFTVIGIDLSEETVTRVSKELAVHETRFKATTDLNQLPNCDAVLICVPTPLGANKQPDLHAVCQAGMEIGTRLRKGQLVVLESTTYPGTTREVLLPILDQGRCYHSIQMGTSEMMPGEEWFVAYSPERVDPGRDILLKDVPKVVGGIERNSYELAKTLYAAAFREVVGVSNAETAEAVKLQENIYRAVNIALVNELKCIFNDMSIPEIPIDIWEVIQAASTKPYGFQAFYPGPGVGGHCFPGTEWVLLRRNGITELTQFEKLWESGYTDVLETLGTEGWKPINTVTRRLYTGDLYSIKTGYGRRLTVTDEHPILLAQDETVFAKDLIVGEFIPLSPTCKGQKRDVVPFNLLSTVPDAIARKMKVIHPESWQNYRQQIYGATESPFKYDWVTRSSGIPLDLYRELVGQGSIPEQENLMIATGKGKSFQICPATIQPTPAVFRMIGYYLAEGCITEDESLRTRWTFSHLKEEALEDLCITLTQIGLRWSRYDQDNSYHIKVSSEVFGRWLRDGLQCGTDCYSKQLPTGFLDLPKDLTLSLLAGLIRGDGSLGIKRDKGTEISFFSVSEQLAREVAYLLQTQGIHASFGRKTTQDGLNLRIFGDEALDQLEEVLVPSKEAQLRRTQSQKVVPYRKSHVLENIKGRVCTPVRGIEKTSVRDFPVFSIETEGHILTAGDNLLVHNCIPLDPYYLSWKAREVGWPTRFIELAGEINDAMPDYVIQRTMLALNERGKALKGSKILVLGIAYKPDVADARESPGTCIFHKFRKLGAETWYDDPHVKQMDNDQSYTLLEDAPALKEFDAVVIVTAHTAYDWTEIQAQAQLIVDTRNVLAGDNVVKA